ncbi:zinc transporter 10 [Wyeomyia smithii]|uniref:zinc transporter 10 n=1 Tax=Wyeomyia smithii TaxID=174621 RepID=UPI002467B238|nr:zinc transporter 10 [Wyeomyia smithii]XP_055536091.1 zinc transporter 10 [Wyeomyia smithii]XP_055536092.1 zinc transporter 10 [Wyeomyia smithii]
MPMKEWIYRLQPMQLYIVLVLSILYLLVQLFLSHISHALVLLVDSYHMLCNIIALSGYILTIKHSKKSSTSETCRLRSSVSQNSINNTSGQGFVELTPIQGDATVEVSPNPNEPSPAVVKQKSKAKSRQQRETSLRNTFGWTRIDVLTMLVVCILLASFCFSAVVEALQTLSHIHHQDAMHYPIPVLILGSLGIILNGFCYLLIGGYTYHQGSFLYITSSGDVVLDRVVTGDGMRRGERRLSGSRKHVAGMSAGKQNESPKRQSVREMMRDICSTLFVIFCAMIVHYTNEDEDTSKFVDPLCSIMSCVVLLTLSYPYMKESGMILLQTIPDTIDIDIFEKSLMDSFPDIVSVHDLHIWQLSSNKYVSTAHIIFGTTKVYAAINDQVITFFHDQGINQVTIQPEFKTKLPELPLLAAAADAPTSAGTTAKCLMQCRQVGCLERHCCDNITKDNGKRSAAPLPTPDSSGAPAVVNPKDSEEIPLEVRCTQPVENVTTSSNEHRSVEVPDEPPATETVVVVNAQCDAQTLDNSTTKTDPDETKVQ